MSEPFIGEIRILPYGYAPVNWAYCDGSLLSIAQHTALFAVIGITYGGDGRTTFGLPNLIGKVPLGTDFSQYRLGASGGSAQVTLTLDQLPTHTHQMMASSSTSDTSLCENNRMLGKIAGRGNKIYSENTEPLVNLNSRSLSSVGGTKAHENRQPFLAINFCIALEGVYPPRS